MKFVRKLAAAWAASWLFLLWTVFCISVGAGWMYLAIVGVLKAQGLEL